MKKDKRAFSLVCNVDGIGWGVTTTSGGHCGAVDCADGFDGGGEAAV
jgi:hypothetical protein